MPLGSSARSRNLDIGTTVNLHKLVYAIRRAALFRTQGGGGMLDDDAINEQLWERDMFAWCVTRDKSINCNILYI